MLTSLISAMTSSSFIGPSFEVGEHLFNGFDPIQGHLPISEIGLDLEGVIALFYYLPLPEISEGHAKGLLA